MQNEDWYTAIRIYNIREKTRTIVTRQLKVPLSSNHLILTIFTRRPQHFSNNDETFVSRMILLRTFEENENILFQFSKWRKRNGKTLSWLVAFQMSWNNVLNYSGKANKYQNEKLNRKKTIIHSKLNHRKENACNAPQIFSIANETKYISEYFINKSSCLKSHLSKK